MKNTNFKTKLIARILLLILLLTSAVSLAGCGKWYPDKKYIMSTYSFQSANSSQISLIATSNTKVFSKDNVTFDLSYAMYSKNIRGETSLDDSNDLYVGYLNKYDVLFGVYITDNRNIRYPTLITDSIENLNGFYFVKRVSESEALSEEYARIYPKLAIGEGGDIYNHTEEITVPKMYVSEEKGTFAISIIAFIWNEENSVYKSIASSKIIFDYETIDNNTIKIDMEDYKLYFVIP